MVGSILRGSTVLNENETHLFFIVKGDLPVTLNHGHEDGAGHEDDHEGGHYDAHDAGHTAPPGVLVVVAAPELAQEYTFLSHHHGPATSARIPSS